jgi:hypothetical protein
MKGIGSLRRNRLRPGCCHHPTVRPRPGCRSHNRARCWWRSNRSTPPAKARWRPAWPASPTRSRSSRRWAASFRTRAAPPGCWETNGPFDRPALVDLGKSECENMSGRVDRGRQWCRDHGGVSRQTCGWVFQKRRTRDCGHERECGKGSRSAVLSATVNDRGIGVSRRVTVSKTHRQDANTRVRFAFPLHGHGAAVGVRVAAQADRTVPTVQGGSAAVVEHAAVGARGFASERLATA